VIKPFVILDAIGICSWILKFEFNIILLICNGLLELRLHYLHYGCIAAALHELRLHYLNCVWITLNCNVILHFSAAKFRSINYFEKKLNLDQNFGFLRTNNFKLKCFKTKKYRRNTNTLAVRTGLGLVVTPILFIKSFYIQNWDSIMHIQNMTFRCLYFFWHVISLNDSKEKNNWIQCVAKIDWTTYI
jgi:hypothetical protein